MNDNNDEIIEMIKKIFRTIEKDLNEMEEILSVASFPIIMTVFSGIDLICNLLYENKKNNGTEKFKSFIEEYLYAVNSKYNNNDIKFRFYKLRCELVHNAYIYNDFVTANGEDNKNRHLQVDEDGKIFIHPKCLSCEFISVMNSFLKELTSNKNASIINNFKNLCKNNKNEINKLIHKYKLESKSQDDSLNNNNSDTTGTDPIIKSIENY